MRSLSKIILNILIILLTSKAQLNFSNIVCIDINDVLLKNTNDKRALHQAPSLTINPELIPGAIEYAKVLSEKCYLAHDKGDFGENLFLSRNPAIVYNNLTDFGAINAFYSEISCYCGYETDCPFCVFGHFTQLVWESSKTQGCGTCMNQETRCIIVVCRYQPAGNMKGEYDKNVKKPYGDPIPLLEVFKTASIAEYGIAVAILAIFFIILMFSFMLHVGRLSYFL